MWGSRPLWGKGLALTTHTRLVDLPRASANERLKNKTPTQSSMWFKVFPHLTSGFRKLWVPEPFRLGDDGAIEVCMGVAESNSLKCLNLAGLREGREGRP